MAGVSIEVNAAAAIQHAREYSTDKRAEVADQAAAIARGTAVVRRGAYRGGIGVEVDGDEVVIVDTDPASFYKELGTVDTPAHAAIIQAASQFGEYSGLEPRGGGARSRRNAGAR